MRKLLIFTAVALLAASTFAGADTLTMKNGTVLTGRVIPEGESYWIKLDSGGSKMVAQDAVASFTRGASAPEATPALASPSLTSPASAAVESASFAETKAQADRVDAPLAAVALWQSYIDNNPKAPDLAAANAELEQWKKLDADHAEKINDKWIGGEARKKLLEQVHQLLKESAELQDTQTLKAISKLEQAVKLDPNNWEANFELGFYDLVKGGNAKYDQAIHSLETAARLRPNSAATFSDLAIAYNFRQRYEQSVLTAYKAAQIEDTKAITQNLVNSIAQAPPGMRENNTKVRPIMEEAVLLARKHGITDGRQSWVYVRPKGHENVGAQAGDDEQDTRPGVIGNGSGFLVSADGYILTNRHVAKEKNCTFVARFSDGTEKPATVVAIDDDSDVAILKIKGEKPFPFLHLAAEDDPPTGADCTALGFPIADVMHYSMQVTSGTVSSVSPTDAYPVTLTCKITHGNSGGPLVDKFGNVIGIVSAGLTAYTETYGKALSVHQVRAFLQKNADKIKATFTPGATTSTLDTETIFKKVSPATVCIILIRGPTNDHPPAAQ